MTMIVTLKITEVLCRAPYRQEIISLTSFLYLLVGAVKKFFDQLFLDPLYEPACCRYDAILHVHLEVLYSVLIVTICAQRRTAAHFLVNFSWSALYKHEQFSWFEASVTRY